MAAWNKPHPDQQVSGEEIPAGRSSEEVITAAIAAGNAPCLVFNGSPSAISGWVKQGGLVPLNDFPDGVSYIEGRSGPTVAAEYKSTDGKYYQLPWKSNPVMIFYNKDMFKAAGLDPDSPGAVHVRRLPAAAQKLVSSGVAQYAIAPAPTNEFFQNWFDFYPLYIAESGGQALVTRTARPPSTTPPARPSPTSGRSIVRGEPGAEGEVQRRRVRGQEVGDGDRRAVGHRESTRTR